MVDSVAGCVVTVGVVTVGVLVIGVGRVIGRLVIVFTRPGGSVGACGRIVRVGVAAMAGLCLDQQITTMLRKLEDGGDQVDPDRCSDASERPDGVLRAGRGEWLSVAGKVVHEIPAVSKAGVATGSAQPAIGVNEKS